MTTEINRSALLPYSTDKVFALVNDVAAYPQFMEGCAGAEVLAEGSDEQGRPFMEARLDLAKAGLQQSFVTRNILTPPVSVQMSLLEGPFESFAGLWELKPLGDSACKVNLTVQFSLNSRALGAAAKALFNPIADNLVDAVVKRAHALFKV